MFMNSITRPSPQLVGPALLPYKTPLPTPQTDTYWIFLVNSSGKERDPTCLGCLHAPGCFSSHTQSPSVRALHMRLSSSVSFITATSTLKTRGKIPLPRPNLKTRMQSLICDYLLYMEHYTSKSFPPPNMCFSVMFILQNEQGMLLYFKLTVCGRSTL